MADKDRDIVPTPPVPEHDALDDVLEDSFPASDPPSFTPITSLGSPTEVSSGEALCELAEEFCEVQELCEVVDD